mgnify:CR=1 FL=1
MKKLTAIIVGGTGQFGIITSNILLKKNYEVIITTRSAKKIRTLKKSKNYIKPSKKRRVEKDEAIRKLKKQQEDE